MAKHTEAKISDFGMTQINTVQLTEHIEKTIQFGGNIAIFGHRGGGKTAISKQCISEAGFHELYVNASVFERTDFAGYPDLMRARKEGVDSKYIEFIMPSFYKCLIEGDKKVVVLLDEVDKADPSVWAPLLEFVQFHSMNGRPLPNLHAIIMTGNLAAEGGQRPCLPLLDRTEKYLLDSSDSNAWINWAGKTGEIHPSIIAYIKDKPDDLIGKVDPGDVYADPSPRSWHNSSKLVQAGEKLGWSNNIIVSKVCGCVGKKAGLEYKSYFEHYQEVLPLVDKIMKGEDFDNTAKAFKKLQITKQIVGVMTLCTRFARVLDNGQKMILNDSEKMTTAEHKKKFAAMSDNTSLFLKDHVDPEISIICIRSQIGLIRFFKNDLENHKSWKSVIVEVKKQL